jgi:DNA (cytosine-5)-methyltransferase 1
VTLTVGSLFSGVGGFELGMERAGLRCLFQVEIDPRAQKILARHWPQALRFPDVRTVGAHCLPVVDVLVGGFPCTDISSARTAASGRAGLDGAESGLWREFARIVGELRPRWVVAENSPEWRRWVPRVRRDLHALGYASLPVRVRAADVGAPHERPRAFVLAHADGQGEPLLALHAEMASLPPPAVLGGHWRAPPPGGFRVDDGVPRGMERCRMMGRAVVPQVAEYLGRLIARHSRSR